MGSPLFAKLLKMDAGRELDKEIHHLVTRRGISEIGGKWIDTTNEEVPCYSTDETCAFELAQKILRGIVTLPVATEFTVEVQRKGGTQRSTGPTEALAYCRAVFDYLNRK